MTRSQLSAGTATVTTLMARLRRPSDATDALQRSDRRSRDAWRSQPDAYRMRMY